MRRAQAVPQALFAAALALLVLICALTPLGLPATKSRGSAFNPADVSVAVRPRAERPAATPGALRPDPLPPAPLACVATMLVTGIIVACGRSAGSGRPGPRIVFQTPVQPRAPPAR